jgi:homoserine dehydrogenase
MGTVGCGVVDILNRNSNKIVQDINSTLTIEKILVRTLNKKRPIAIDESTLTTNIADVIDNEAIDIVVELMGGIEPTYQYVARALNNKKHVVTANKALIATHGPELHSMAEANGVSLRYEASVAGGIPVLGTLTDELVINQFDQITGIINGTTNYILTLMTDKGMAFDQALQMAMDNGYAEADPTSDIEGEDVAFKLAILIAKAYGVYVDPLAIPREGIAKISNVDIEYAEQLGYKIKLLASAKLKNNQLINYVHPVLVPKKHPLAAVSDEFNALFIKGNAVGEVMLYGKGAGMLPTGSAVTGDIAKVVKDINNGICPKNPVPDEAVAIEYMGEGKGEYYIRMEAADSPGVLARIADTFAKYDISLESVVQRGCAKNYIPLVLITHQTQRELLDKALDEIVSSDNLVKEVASILKVEKFL